MYNNVSAGGGEEPKKYNVKFHTHFGVLVCVCVHAPMLCI
jgi:hypothetical protein